MLFHLIHHAVQVLEEFYMAQLIQFIMTDDLEVHVLLCLFDVCLRRNESCNSGSRIAYFRGGYELIDHIRISGFLALLDDVQQVILSVIIQVMDDICIIPENTEVFGCRFQVCKSSDGLIGVGVACGLEYFGTHQIPLMASSSATSFSTMSMSGPSGVIGTLIISTPKYSVTPK